MEIMSSYQTQKIFKAYPLDGIKLLQVFILLNVSEVLTGMTGVSMTAEILCSKQCLLTAWAGSDPTFTNCSDSPVFVFRYHLTTIFRTLLDSSEMRKRKLTEKSTAFKGKMAVKMFANVLQQQAQQR